MTKEEYLCLAQLAELAVLVVLALLAEAALPLVGVVAQVALPALAVLVGSNPPQQENDTGVAVRLSRLFSC